MTPEALSASARKALAEVGGTIREVKMFGGIGFMLDGNMVAAVSKRGLLLRVGRDRYAAALTQPGARAMEMQGREMPGYVRVDMETLTDRTLKTWLADASAFVRTLPPKTAGGGKAAAKKRERKGKQG
jgi:TfoX/Sxy family transcriptional regulator of competence genes